MKTLSKEDCAWILEQEKRSGHDMNGYWQELPFCLRCHGYEGGLPTHCPGTHMSGEISDLVYKGKMDFRDGRWVKAPTVAMAHAYGCVRCSSSELQDAGMVQA